MLVSLYFLWHLSLVVLSQVIEAPACTDDLSIGEVLGRLKARIKDKDRLYCDPNAPMFGPNPSLRVKLSDNRGLMAATTPFCSAHSALEEIEQSFARYDRAREYILENWDSPFEMTFAKSLESSAHYSMLYRLKYTVENKESFEAISSADKTRNYYTSMRFNLLGLQGVCEKQGQEPQYDPRAGPVFSPGTLDEDNFGKASYWCNTYCECRNVDDQRWLAVAAAAGRHDPINSLGDALSWYRGKRGSINTRTFRSKQVDVWRWHQWRKGNLWWPGTLGLADATCRQLGP
ncbi:MAG: hypothetical protein M1814_005981 [Vezdaea aestivalis]|nr:MAG: hypothetical protein M1814_005981 [Vezdaea aestivalis]